MSKHYINDPGYEVPENKILLVPHLGSLEEENVPAYLDIVKSLKGEIKRDWFSNYFYYCLPLSIGNQYGFTIHSNFDFDAKKYDDLEAPESKEYRNAEDDEG